MSARAGRPGHGSTLSGLSPEGMDRAVPLIGAELLVNLFPLLAKQLKIDTARPGFVKLRGHDIEWVTGNVTFDSVKQANKEPLHRFMLGCPAVRMIKPFDWLAFLRQWKVECEEVRFERRHGLQGHR